MNNILESFAQLVASPSPKEIAGESLSGEKLSSFAKQYGLQPLLVYILNRSEFAKSWPSQIFEDLRQCARDQAAMDLVYEKELVDVLASLADSCVRPLLMKGMSLSYTHYPARGLRPHYDIDMLIRKEDINDVFDVMEKHGYQYQRIDDLLTRQIGFSKKGPFNIDLVFDIHWHISNRPLFLNTLTYTEINREGIHIPELGDNAYTLNPIHALLLACLHRVAEGAFGENENLLWLYDIHLLLSAMSKSEFRKFIVQVNRKQILAICLDALNTSAQLLNTDIPAWAIEALSGDTTAEPSARLLKSGAPRYKISDLYRIPGLRNKFSGVLEALFPPSAYMMHYEKSSNKFLLPVFYTRRILRGLS